MEAIPHALLFSKGKELVPKTFPPCAAQTQVNRIIQKRKGLHRTSKSSTGADDLAIPVERNHSIRFFLCEFIGGRMPLALGQGNRKKG